jgi:hypothetical protein
MARVGVGTIGAGIPLAVVLGLGLAGLVIIHAVLSWGMPGPTIIDNELGYLANARVLGGLDSTPIHPLFTPTNYVGYSLLLVPLYWLRVSPDAVYQGALVVNALLGSGAGLLAYIAARRIFELAVSRALVAGLLVGLYPSVLLNASFAWAENLLFVLILALVLASHRLVSAPGVVTVTAFAAVAGLLPFTHPRMLTTTVLSAGLLAALAWRRRLPVPLALIGLGTIIAVVVAGQRANGALMPHIYGERAEGFARGELDSYREIITDFGVFGETLLRVAGGVWYLGAASAGLALAGFVALVATAIGRGPFGSAAAAARWTAGFAAAGALSALVMSGATVADAAGRLDYYFYGRYVDAWAPPLILAAAALLVSAPWRRAVAPIWAAGVAMTAVAWAVVYVGNGPSLFRSGDIGGAAVLGVLAPSWAAIPPNGGFRIGLATTVTVVVAALIIAAGMVRREIALALVAVVFVASAAVAQDRYVTRQSEAITALATLQDRPELRGVSDLSYDMAAQDGPTPATLAGPLLQFHLPWVQFHLFDSAEGELPEYPVVIADADWPGGAGLGATLVATEPAANQALWLLPRRAEDAPGPPER